MLNFCLYKPCAMCLSLLHCQPCAGSEPDCNCCLSNKYTYMQLRSPEVTRVNFHLSVTSGSKCLLRSQGPLLGGGQGTGLTRTHTHTHTHTHTGQGQTHTHTHTQPHKT